MPMQTSSPRRSGPLDRLVAFWTSLQLTIIALAFGMAVILIGTLAQVRIGIDQAVEQYFRAWLVWWSPPGAGWRLPIFPGGFLVGAVLLINLLAAFCYRFRFSARQIGIWLIHGGLIVLLLGELLTAVSSRESYVRLNEGETRAYSEAYRETELVIIDRSAPQTDRVTAIAEDALQAGTLFQRAELPFLVRVAEFLPNAHLHRHARMGSNPGGPSATRGLGVGFEARALPRTGNPNERDRSTGWIELIGTEGSLGTWMVSSEFNQPQRVEYAGRVFDLELRLRRFYKPYALTLLDFTHERYAGTEIPRAFSSRVRLVHPAANEDREVLISMNQPLRYDGLTFYQSGYEGENVTILQVVRNPGRHLPYISCVLVSLGLLTQFGWHLFGFSRRERARGRPAAKKSWIPWIVTAGAGLALAAGFFRSSGSTGARDWKMFGQLPTLMNGRIKPLDTVARTSLLMLHDKQSLRLSDGPKLSAIAWLAEVLYAPAEADRRAVFRIHDPEVLGLFGWQQTDRKDFSFEELTPFFSRIDEQARLANDVEAQVRSNFQRHILELYRQLVLFQQLKNTVQPEDTADFADELAQYAQLIATRARPASDSSAAEPDSRWMLLAQRYGRMSEMAAVHVAAAEISSSDDDYAGWKTAGASLLESVRQGTIHPVVQAHATLGRAYRESDHDAFNHVSAELTGWLEARYPAEMRKARLETAFNRFAPFYQAMVLYVVITLLACLSWLTGPGKLRRTAHLLTGLALLIHLGGIGLRMYIEGRPPVTNLYSSAVFVGFVAVVIAFFLERLFATGIGSAVGGVVGFCTLVIAHHLSLSGDTMEMMRAVLDSNFWLATHVVVITVGYGAVFLAGGLALFYILLGTTSTWLSPERARALGRMVYGVLCFATFTSFVGTVLGGIWADQSWGRFWGWDPKENGAALIVLWCAIVLHARWGGYVRERGLMVMAVMGNIITAWSWFGVNLLAIGLHSYGFTEKGFWWLLGFWISQVAVMLIGGLLPHDQWRSLRLARSSGDARDGLPRPNAAAVGR